MTVCEDQCDVGADALPFTDFTPNSPPLATQMFPPLGLFYDIKKLENFSKVTPSTHEKMLGSPLVLDAKKR